MYGDKKTQKDRGTEDPNKTGRPQICSGNNLRFLSLLREDFELVFKKEQ